MLVPIGIIFFGNSYQFSSSSMELAGGGRVELITKLAGPIDAPKVREPPDLGAGLAKRGSVLFID